MKREDCGKLVGKTMKLHFPVIFEDEGCSMVPQKDYDWTVLDAGPEGLVIELAGGDYTLTIPYQFVGKPTLDSTTTILLKGRYSLKGEEASFVFTDNISGEPVSN